LLAIGLIYFVRWWEERTRGVLIPGYLEFTLEASPFLSIAIGGCIEGISIEGRHLGIYFMCGVLISFITFIGMSLGAGWSVGASSAADTKLMLVASIVAAFQVMLFMTFAMIGDWFEKRKSVRISCMSRLAIAIAQFGSKDSGDMAKRAEVWTKVINGLTPVLTLVGTIITGYFTYLAAMARR
jgi:hypothetical protein